MAPKELTPYQISSGISYVQKEAPFLARLKGKSKEKEIAAKKFKDYEDGQDDDDYDELEGAQVVELDKHGKEIHKDAGVKSDEEKEEGEEKEEEKLDDQPAVDENGRILFRKQKKKPSSTSTKRKLNDIIDEELTKSGLKSKQAKVKKASKKDKKVSLLSFDDEE